LTKNIFFRNKTEKPCKEQAGSQTRNLAAVAFFYARFGVAFILSHRKLLAWLPALIPAYFHLIMHNKFFGKIVILSEFESNNKKWKNVNF